MALGVSRLLLSLSAMKRFSFATVDADFILTQLEDFILTQSGRPILANQSTYDTNDPASFFLTQDGLNILLTQADAALSTEQYIAEPVVEGATKFIITQDLQRLISQEGLDFILNAPTQFDLILTQSGDALLTQDGSALSLQQTQEVVVDSPFEYITTQDGEVLLTQNEDALIQDKLEDPVLFLTQSGDLLITQDLEGIAA
jgi:hypothetical protein